MAEIPAQNVTLSHPASRGGTHAHGASGVEQQQDAGRCAAKRGGGSGRGDEGDYERDDDGGGDGQLHDALEAAALVAGTEAGPAAERVTRDA